MIRFKTKILLLILPVLVTVIATACGMTTEKEMVKSNESHKENSTINPTSAIENNSISKTTKSEKATTRTEVINYETEIITDSKMSEISSATQSIETTIETTEESILLTDEQTDVQGASSSENDICSEEMSIDNDSQTIIYTPITPSVSEDGNVLLISSLIQQIGNEPLRISQEESSVLIKILNEITMQPIDSPDPMNIPIGGGYIMEIEGEETYKFIGGRYVKIGNDYFYDTNGKSDEISAKIGDVLYSYYGEPK